MESTLLQIPEQEFIKQEFITLIPLIPPELEVIDVTKMSIEESQLMEAKLIEKLDTFRSDDATGGFIESDEYLALDHSRKPH